MMDDDLQPLSRTALKAQRLKPAVGQEPVKRVWSQKRREHIELYDPQQCEPMRAKRPSSAAQLAALEAGRRLLTHGDCADCGVNLELYLLDRQRRCPACAELREVALHRSRDIERQFALQDLLGSVIPARTVYLDTETTGLDGYGDDELLEICIVDNGGNVLLDSLVKPGRHQHWAHAQAIHGITPADVATAPALATLLPRLQAIVEGCDVLVIYNAAFDLPFLPEPLQSMARAKARCALQACALYNGDWNDWRESYRWPTLGEAASWAGHKWEGQAHRARADALATRKVWRWMHERLAAASETPIVSL